MKHESNSTTDEKDILSVIEKENIPNYDFPLTEVLTTDFEIDYRDLNLHKALILGNTYRRKVKIIFMTTEGKKQVETTIWAVTEKNVLLKSGIFIPIYSIVKVQFY